jgi:3-polyprenyl-4-hydroxybenzoate decarboxylase
VRVTAITHRDKPIFRGTLKYPAEDAQREQHHELGAARRRAGWNILSGLVPGVIDLHCPSAYNGTTLMIQLNRPIGLG